MPRKRTDSGPGGDLKGCLLAGVGVGVGAESRRQDRLRGGGGALKMSTDGK